MPNVIVSEIAQVFTSAKKRATPRPKARSRSRDATVPRIEEPRTTFTPTTCTANVDEPEDVEEPRRPRDRHRVEGREEGVSGHRVTSAELRRVQRREPLGEGVQLRVGADEGRHERVVGLHVLPGGPGLPVRAVVPQRRQEHRGEVGVHRRGDLPDAEVAVARVAGGALGAEDGLSRRTRSGPPAAFVAQTAFERIPFSFSASISETRTPFENICSAMTNGLRTPSRTRS